jgi:DNA-binding transcriptional LysR family regulator
MMKQASDRIERPCEIQLPKGYRASSVNLKQWVMFHAVVSCGSYSGAAEMLQVSQPAISYSIARLEEQLGVPLLKLEGRKAHLTGPGRVLIERSRSLLREAMELEQFADELKTNWRPEIGLAVHKDFPSSVLIPAIRAFSQQPRSAKINLIEGSMPQIERVIREQSVDLAINMHVPHGLHGDLLVEMEYVAVAHPGHPLFALEREITPMDLEHEVQVLPSSEFNMDIATKGKSNKGGDNAQLWQVSSFDTAERALSEGLGYGWLPRQRIQQSLNSGRLRILPVQNRKGYKSTFYLIHGPSILTSEASRLADVLRRTVTDTF